MTNTKTLLAVAAGLAFSIAGISTANAATSADSAATRIVVRYTDTELATPEGVRRVQQRILTAVAQACPGGEIGDLEHWASTAACRTQALAHAAAQVKSPQLAAVLAVKSGQG